MTNLTYSKGHQNSHVNKLDECQMLFIMFGNNNDLGAKL